MISGSIGRLRLPGRAGRDVESVVAAERALEARADAHGRPLLNATYADTQRFPAPEWALESYVAAARGGGPSYTPYRGDATVREHVAMAVGGFLGVSVDPERELILTPGTQAAVFSALAALLDPGDRVVMIDPDYLAYERLLSFLGAEIAHVPLRWSGGTGHIDAELLREAATPGTRCLILSNPNNPTGAVLDPANVAAIARVAGERDLYVIIDELYARLVYDARPYAHLAAEPGMAERAITLLGPSKTESMSGYRVGAAVAPPAVTDAMEDVLSVSALRAPAYAQWTLVPWLRDDAEFLSARVAEYEQLRDMTVARLRASAALDVALPGGTAYVFPRLVEPTMTDQELALALLEGADVIVNPGYQFGPRGAGAFRLCFAQEERAWEQALERIVGVLEGVQERVKV
jgi:aspartate/methionine/tyrosine aminotransferase